MWQLYEEQVPQIAQQAVFLIGKLIILQHRCNIRTSLVTDFPKVIENIIGDSMRTHHGEKRARCPFIPVRQECVVQCRTREEEMLHSAFVGEGDDFVA
jgi:hypothetical protein